MDVERRAPKTAPLETAAWPSDMPAPPPTTAGPVAAPPAVPAKIAAPPAPLPVSASSGEEIRPPEPVAAGASAKARILVIDDEGAIREMARDILESAGYQVVTAVDGVDALDVYRREWGRIDLVVLDMVMPRMGGLETYRRLLGMDRSARVLLCTGFSDNDKTQKALKEGALGLLPKPFTMSELLNKIGRALARK